MMMKKKDEDKILDVNAAMQGSLVFSDPVNLRINGKFEGTLTTKGNLIIGEEANVMAEILGENISIAGKVKGKIKANKVALLSTCDVNADVEYLRVSIEEGAIFNGNCKVMQGRMSITELSEYLSVGEDKILEWVKGGEIPAERTGEGLFFSHRDVESWISQHS